MKRFSFHLVAAGVVFLAVIFVPLLVVTVFAQSDGPDPDGTDPRTHCTGLPFDEWVAPGSDCIHPPTVPPTVYVPPTPWCTILDPLTLECLDGIVNTPIPNTPIPDTPIPDTPVPEDTATAIPEDTATAIPEDTATAIPEDTPIPDTPIPPTNTPRPTETPVPLTAPANFNGTPGTTSIELTWDAVSNASGYELEENDAFSCQRGQAGGTQGGAQPRCDGWDTIRTFTSPGVTSHTVPGLPPGLTYSYRIRSYRGPSHSAYAYTDVEIPSGPTRTPTPTPVPTPTLGAPTITRHYSGPASIILEWRAGANATSYKVQQYNYGRFITVGTPRGLHHTVDGYQDRDERRHRVCSVRGSETACSDEVRTRPGPTTQPPTTPPPPTATATPTAPTGLRSRPHSVTMHRSKTNVRGRILLEWNDLGPDVTYEVQQKSNGTWMTLPFGEFTTDGTDGGDVDSSEPAIIIGGLKFREEYEHRVGAAMGDSQSRWSRTLGTPMGLPYLGRQADHTVQYTPLTVMPLTPVPSAIPDPSTTSTSSLATAVAAWAASDVVTSPPGVVVCEVGTCDENRLDDLRRTDILTVSHDWALNCGDYAACIRPRVGTLVDQDGYMDNAVIVIEQPGVEVGVFGLTNVRIWTDNADLHGREVPGGRRLRDIPTSFFPIKYTYLPQVYMHELGHAIGLGDLYLHGGHPGSLMDRVTDVPITSVPDDIDGTYVEQVYRNHTPTTPVPNARMTDRRRRAAWRVQNDIGALQ